MPQKRPSQAALKQRKLFRDDFVYFAERCLTIRTKGGELADFKINKAQQYIHECFQKQIREMGRVRALILKGRQQGASTYTEGRFYWRCIHRKGVKVFIMAHESKATNNLYNMAQRYHDHCPDALKPNTGKSNAKELVFDKLDSRYGLGTAGSDSVGRSDTIQYFHASEVAFWPSSTTGEIAKGAMQAVPDEDNTEVVLESTANGIGNFFHSQCISAMRGETDYQLIFIPWYWQDEYERDLPDNWELTEEEVELLDEHEENGLSEWNLAWRRNKIAEFNAAGEDGGTSFKQEYPFTVHEAFQYSGPDGFINQKAVQKARSTEVSKGRIKVIGVDPSRGGDRFATIIRAGRKMYDPQTYTAKTEGGEITLGRAVQICRRLLMQENPDRMFIDAGGGADLVDRLHELGHHNVVAVPFGGKPLNEALYKNKRAEMWGEMKDWLNDETLDVEIPDRDDLQFDLCAPMSRRDSMDRIVLESKEDMQKRNLPSPDIGDAAALTFAESVFGELQADEKSVEERLGMDPYNTGGIPDTVFE